MEKKLGYKTPQERSIIIEEVMKLQRQYDDIGVDLINEKLGLPLTTCKMIDRVLHKMKMVNDESEAREIAAQIEKYFALNGFRVDLLNELVDACLAYNIKANEKAISPEVLDKISHFHNLKLEIDMEYKKAKTLVDSLKSERKDLLEKLGENENELNNAQMILDNIEKALK